MIAVVRRVNPLEPVLEDKKPKPNYARGSVEWQEEQKMTENRDATPPQRQSLITPNMINPNEKSNHSGRVPEALKPPPTSYVRG